MRIAYVNTVYQRSHTGGGHVHVGQFIKNALELGHEVWVYRGNQYPGAKDIPTNWFEHIKSLRKMDVLYIRIESSFPKICSWSLPPRRSLYGFPVVVWEFNTLPNELDIDNVKSSVEVRYFLKYSPGCDLAVCVSPALEEIVENKLFSKKHITVLNGSDPNKFKPDLTPVNRLHPFNENFNVVWIGTIKQKWHDIDMLGQAARLLWEQKENNNIVFHIIGAGLTGFIADMPPNVFYWGAEHYDRLPNWLSGMDVGLSLYHPGKSYYNAPLKVFDYMSSGLAVVSTEHPLIGDLLRGFGGGDLIIPHGDSKALVDILIQLEKNRERVMHLGAAGRQMVIEKYNWRRAVKDTMDAIEKIFKEKGKTPKA